MLKNKIFHISKSGLLKNKRRKKKKAHALMLLLRVKILRPKRNFSQLWLINLNYQIVTDGIHS